LTDPEKIQYALGLIADYGGIDGDHHKAWALDQIARTLAGENYDAFVADVKNGPDGPDTYGYDVGVAP
jgi:hypothetical protein